MSFDPVYREPLDYVQLPVMYPAQARFPDPRVEDLPRAVEEALTLGGILDRVRSGSRVAVAVGSRGVARIPELARLVMQALRRVGAEPFVIPAMGSHGGATAEGQRQVLADLGVTEASVDAPIVSSMEVVELGRLAGDVPVCMDRAAYEADATVLINRVKPHTDFRGAVESGLAKMCVIGLGKVRTAEAIHAHGPTGLRGLIPQAARIVVERGRVIGGIATVENAYHEVAEVVGVPGEEIGGPVEAALLERARELMPALPFDQIDVLIVDEMGKDVSGTGMDTNIIGRMAIPGVPEPQRPLVKVIVALALTKATHGNAVGLGLADVITERLLNQIDWTVTRVNQITSGILALWRGKLPWVAPNDRAAIRLALRLCDRPDSEKARVVRIRNTLALDRLWISEALLEEARSRPDVSLGDAPVAWGFDGEGMLGGAL
ncbi:MAG: lactate racemase domain-containing protein [Anaerolineae bacterium]